MASSDFTVLNDSLDTATVARGVTGAIARPNGGSSFLYAFNSRASTAGGVGLFTNQSGFAPTTKGGSVRGALQRGAGAGATSFAPMLFIGLQGPSVNDLGYLLGLSDEDPHRIVLRKGSIITGIPSAAVGASGVLARSSSTFVQGTWLHLRLDMIVNDNGDVVLRVYRNDLGSNPVTGPVWAAVPGMDAVTDDALGIVSGSLPYTAGRMGFAMVTSAISRRVYVDHLECFKQS